MDVVEKILVRKHWEANPCNAEMGDGGTQTREYFEAIENKRYALEPEIHQFAQFSRYHGKEVLEIGVGMGTDFLQWNRAGAYATGVDLTEECVALTRARLLVFGFPDEGRVLQADAENLPFADSSFDLVYSWGVIHHSPNTRKALEEIVRVMRPGGEGKVMIYNKWSAVSLMYWCLFALFRLKPWLSISNVFSRHVESPGTKVYSLSEASALFDGLPVGNLKLVCYRKYFTRLTRYPAWTRPFIRVAGEVLTVLLGGVERSGYFLTARFNRLPAQTTDFS